MIFILLQCSTPEWERGCAVIVKVRATSCSGRMSVLLN